MSTRGCVAIGTEAKWTGVYNHYDSYPTGLGKELWDHLRGKDLTKFAEEMLRYDDWRNYLNGGTCEYCGKKGQGQPHGISGVICVREERFKTRREMREYFKSLPAWKGRDDEIKRMVETEWKIRRNIERTGYPDPKAKYHKHGDLTDKITSDNPDPLFIEWVYVVGPEKRTLTVLSNRSDGKTEGAFKKDGPTLRKDGYWDYGHCAFRHVKVAEISLDGREPDWEKIEKSERQGR